MADFFKKEDVQEETTEEQEEVKEEKVKIGEDEYSSEELAGLVGLGKQAKDIESKHGSLDKFSSDWGKKANKIGKLEKELETFKTKDVEKKVETGEKLSWEERVQQAQKQAESIGLATKPKFMEWYAEARAADRLNEKCFKLEGKIDGTDGRPAFKRKDVLDYMIESGVKNPDDAYDLLHKEPLSKWRDEKLSKAKSPGLVTEESSQAGGKLPKKVEINRDNLSEMVKSALKGEM